MKTQHLSKMIGSGVIALSLIALPVIAPASAQTDTPNSTDSSRVSTYNRTDNNNMRDDNNNMSWLGLLGLFGLTGLLKKSHNENSGMR